MNKKTILGFVGAASLALSLSVAAPVLAADTTDPSQSTTTDTSKNTSATSTTNPANSQDTAKTPTTDPTKPADGKDTSKTPSTGTETPKESSKPSNDTSKALSLMGKYAKLTKNSYIYNKDGKRVKKAKLKKGTVILVSGLASPKGKTLIGINNKKNQYINVKNVKLFKAVQYKVKKKSYVYNSKGARKANLYVKKGKTVVVIKAKKIRGKKYVAITDKYYIRWANLDSKSAKIISE